MDLSYSFPGAVQTSDLLQGLEDSHRIVRAGPPVLPGCDVARAEEMDVRGGAADVEDAAAGPDATVDFGGEDVAHEAVAQGDQVGVGGDEEAGEEVEGDGAATVDRQPRAPQDLLDPVRLRAGG